MKIVFLTRFLLQIYNRTLLTSPFFQINYIKKWERRASIALPSHGYHEIGSALIRLEWSLSNPHQFHRLGIAVNINRVGAGDIHPDSNEISEFQICFRLT